MKVINRKFDSFFIKRRAKVLGESSKVVDRSGRVVTVKFDTVSKVHLFSKSCILASYKASGFSKPRVVYSSLPKVMAKVSTKRSVLGRVKRRINQGS